MENQIKFSRVQQAPTVVQDQIGQAPVEQAPKPRFFDQFMAGYVRIGGIVGVALALASFAIVCALSCKMFYHMVIPQGYYLLAWIIGLATIAVGGALAVGVFFFASVMWLPALIGAGFLFLLSIPFLARFHH